MYVCQDLHACAVSCPSSAITRVACFPFPRDASRAFIRWQVFQEIHSGQIFGFDSFLTGAPAYSSIVVDSEKAVVRSCTKDQVQAAHRIAWEHWDAAAQCAKPSDLDFDSIISLSCWQSAVCSDGERI